ncbi:hypothetical protein [Nostoc sp. CHAB 5715]|uniref:hypothetical protein n=1 Tax=Nostoc sp. CHAB 5715 TaxID=2780400 RepID=UPI001E3F993B|nr:hypothetical protein [Nostoc sp. CHAB 5715]MCC5625422.1 hypothetical protein [Nostoc sp. CHAB 5715]
MMLFPVKKRRRGWREKGDEGDEERSLSAGYPAGTPKANRRWRRVAVAKSVSRRFPP